MIKILMPLKYMLYLCFCLFTSSFAWAEDKEDTRICRTLDEYISDGKDRCLPCDVLKIVTDACAIVIDAVETLCPSLAGVVCIGVAIYIAFYVLKNTASFSQKNPFALLSDNKIGLIPLCFKAAIITILLANSYDDIYSLFIGPLIGSCLGVGNTLMDTSIHSLNFDDFRDLFNAIIENVRTYNETLYTIVAMGRMLLCMAFLPEGILKWHWSLIAFGVMLYAMGWMIIIGAAFFILDVAFRIAVACMVLPFAITCAISKYTSTYTKKTWNLFVNVGFNFIIFGLVIQFIFKTIDVVIGGSQHLQSLLRDGLRDEAHAKKIAEDIDLETFLLATIFCLISFRLFMKIEDLAHRVSSTSSVGKLGQELGADVARFVQYPLSKVTKAGKGFINTARLETGRKISESPAGMRVRGWERGIKRGVKKFFGL